MNKYIKYFVLFLFVCFALAAAFFSTDKPNESQPEIIITKPDYNYKNNWLRFKNNNKNTDVFVIYPIVTNNNDAADMPYVRIESKEMRSAAENWIKSIEGLFGDDFNVYAPVYRQINFSILGTLDHDSFVDLSNESSREDAFAAFDYFLNNVNKGERQFIIFGFSQGAQLAAEISSVMLGSPQYEKYNNNHTATYAIGFSVTPEQISKNPHLKFSETPYDNRAVISYNTTALSEIQSGAYKNFVTWTDRALVTNPISWTMDEDLLEQGSGKANAIIDKARGLLTTTNVDEAGYLPVSNKISRFHTSDIPFYYDSIKKNLRERR